MGCFSYICNGCGNPINSDSYTGEHVIMFLIEAGEVLEWMQGQYNSYGRVFKDDLMSSQQWVSMEWDKICDLIFNSNERDGLAVYHSGCYRPTMTLYCSDPDPDQGWSYHSYAGRGKYPFPSKGDFFHGLKKKPEPKWAPATKT